MKTMRITFYAALLGVLVLVGSSCRHKELCYYHHHTQTLNVVFDWTNAPEASVVGMYLYLYPVSGGVMQQFYLPSGGGQIDVPYGEYRAIAVNTGTEATLVRGSDQWETLELHTREASVLEGMTSMSVTGGEVPKADGAASERVVLAPDSMYVTREESVLVRESAEVQTIVMYPSEETCVYTYEIRNVKNLQYVSSVSGTLSGLSPSYFAGTDVLSSEGVTVPFATESDGVSTLRGRFVTFGCADALSKADAGHQLVIYGVMADGGKYYYTYDVSDQVHGAENPRRVHIALDGLEFEEPVHENEGGIQPEVGEWVQEEVSLPMSSQVRH